MLRQKEEKSKNTDSCRSLSKKVFDSISPLPKGDLSGFYSTVEGFSDYKNSKLKLDLNTNAQENIRYLNTTASDHLRHLLRIGWKKDSELIKTFVKTHQLEEFLNEITK